MGKANIECEEFCLFASVKQRLSERLQVIHRFVENVGISFPVLDGFSTLQNSAGFGFLGLIPSFPPHYGSYDYPYILLLPNGG